MNKREQKPFAFSLSEGFFYAKGRTLSYGTEDSLT